MILTNNNSINILINYKFDKMIFKCYKYYFNNSTHYFNINKYQNNMYISELVHNFIHS